jgi:hypothetical protein
MNFFEPAEKGVPIRVPSTANLMISSEDRVDISGSVPIGTFTRYPSPWDFQITRRQALLNGFFTRIGMTEIVLDWEEPNIIESENNTLSIDLSGGSTVTATLVTGFYTVAQALNAIVADLSGSGISVVGSGGTLALKGTTAFSIQSDSLAFQLGFITGAAPATLHYLFAPDLRPYSYIDFVSEQLTYNQELKDATTNPYAERNVICRWYFAWDEQPYVDEYGIPILQGYTPFVQRRLFNPPKQVRWDSTMPLGNLAFTVYSPRGAILPSSGNYGLSKWDMTLQISEV